MADKKIPFQLVFAENLKKDVSITSTPNLSFDDLGDFLEEREKLKRYLENNFEAELRVDYSDFANHVFFDSATSKFNIAKNRILQKYPYNGSREIKDAYFLTSSGYENYVLEEWPRYVGYAFFNGTDQFISASDTDNKFYIGTSSLHVSAWIRPVITTQNIILQVMSASESTAMKNGYDFYLSGATDPHLKFSLYSGSQKVSVSASYALYTGSFNNVAAIYNNSEDLLYLYINGTKASSGTVNFGSIEFTPTKLYVGSGSQYGVASSSYAFYSGSMDEVRILLTASLLYHSKNYNRPIDSETYVALNYRFNEGVTETGSIDAVVVDYSKNGIHGKFLNYTSAGRVSGSVMATDPGDPILYSFHSSVKNFSASALLSASDFDRQNNNQIFNMIPEYVLSADDEQEGLMTAFTLAMARFFDELKLYIDQIDNLKSTNYDEVNDAPDVFLPYLIRYFGWKVTEHFGDANPLSFFFGDSVLASGSMEVPLYEIKNQFWRRTLNNLPYLLKTKGKRNNLDSFFNVLGVNQENINLKEYGYLPGGSIVDTRIHKEKVVSFLGIGTGSLSSSYVKVPSLITGSNNAYTVETLVQLPYISASYSGNLTVLTGSIWQLVDPDQVTGSFALLWNVPSLGSTTGKFILTGSAANGGSQIFSSSNVEVFDGDFVYVAAGLKSNQLPFIEVKTIDNDEVDFSGTYVGSVAFSGVFTGSKFDFIMGATSGTFFQKATQGYYGQYKYWNRPLSASEMVDHALNFESVGISDPTETPAPLRAYWPLNETGSADASGLLSNVKEVSRNGLLGSGSGFPISTSPYRKFLIEYNYLSPNLDLKWTENKVRVRNKEELLLKDIANDTNEVALEFNLVDALNRDITKIFSTFDLINNAIGRPVNKYREEYADLEAYRKVYFDRLGDSIHFSAFFNLFRWFDKKLSDSIKQLLPARVKFVGGEQVVESHMLERPRYGYKYPIFRTPVDIPNAELSGVVATSGFAGESLQSSRAAVGTYVNTQYEQEKKIGLLTSPRDASVGIEGTSELSNIAVSLFNEGDERPDRLSSNPGFFRIKTSGDSSQDSSNPNSAINSRNEYSRKTLNDAERRNLDGFKSGSFVNAKLGNGFVIKGADSSLDQEHYFTNYKKYISFLLKPQAFSSYFLSSSDNLTTQTVDVSFAEYANTIYMSTTVGGNVATVYRSANFSSSSGVTLFYDGTAGNTRGIRSLCVTPNGTVFIGLQNSSGRWLILRNHHTGSSSTWTTVYTGVVTGSIYGRSSVNALAFDPSTNTIFAGGAEGRSDDTGLPPAAIIRSSSDFGVNWGEVLLVSGADTYINSIDISGGFIYAGGKASPSGSHATDNILWKSTAAGVSGSWTQVHNNFAQCDLDAVWCLRLCSNGNIFVAGVSGSVFNGDWTVAKTHVTASANDLFYVDRSPDLYSPVGSVPTGVPFGRQNIIAVSPNDPNYILVIGTLFNGPTNRSGSLAIRRSLNGGTTWHDVYQKPSTNPEYGSAGSGIIITQNNDIFFAENFSGTSPGGVTTRQNVNKLIPANEFIFSSSTSSSVQNIFTKYEFLNNYFSNNDASIEDENFVKSNFGVSGSNYFNLILPEFSFEISSSKGAFTSSNFSVTFQDEGSSVWSSPVDIGRLGVYSNIDADGYYKFLFNFSLGSSTRPPFLSFNRTGLVNIRMSSSKGIHVVRDVKIKFQQPLTNDGVKYYKDLDNQNIDFFYLNANVLKDIE